MMGVALTGAWRGQRRMSVLRVAEVSSCSPL
jgi:hypothetical protein